MNESVVNLSRVAERDVQGAGQMWEVRRKREEPGEVTFLKS